MKRRIEPLALIGGILMLADSVWGVLAALGLDPSRTNELIMGISFVIGFPTYLLDLWMDKRIAAATLGLFVFRWIATCFGGPTPILCNPLRGSMLLVAAILLLQLSKVRRGRKLRQAA